MYAASQPRWGLGSGCSLDRAANVQEGPEFAIALLTRKNVRFDSAREIIGQIAVGITDQQARDLPARQTPDSPSGHHGTQHGIRGERWDFSRQGTTGAPQPLKLLKSAPANVAGVDVGSGLTPAVFTIGDEV